MSLQNLKKEVLYADNHQIFYKLALVARHVQSTQNWKLMIFLYLVRRSQNTHSSSVWPGVMQQPVAFFN